MRAATRTALAVAVGTDSSLPDSVLAGSDVEIAVSGSFEEIDTFYQAKLAALGWAGWRVFDAFRRGASDSSAYLGTEFAITAGLLVALAWALPWWLARRARPSRTADSPSRPDRPSSPSEIERWRARKRSAASAARTAHGGSRPRSGRWSEGAQPPQISCTASVVTRTISSASSRVRHSGGAKPMMSPSGMARAMTLFCSSSLAAICGPDTTSAGFDGDLLWVV